MKLDWEAAIDSLSQISVIANQDNRPVTVHNLGEEITCIGIGTDAAVFRHQQAPAYAFKIYAAEKQYKIKIEEHIYNLLEGSPYFSSSFGSTDRYLILGYEEGITLYDCIQHGVHIPTQVIEDVEDAREYVRSMGLHPRDIHLKNILLQNGRAKIIDVSEYVHPGNDFRWEHLKQAYEEYYHLIDGKEVPLWLIEKVRKWYNQRKVHFSSYDDFMKIVLKFAKHIKP
ncbi:serine/threonine protein kinase [Pontibacillus salicampi]|uniref:Serine/threonine protein kinase n=1 Tax=Pontibacillus salicampi TaxID=1449801 RepID=A0ABV6LQ30_9BACI